MHVWNMMKLQYKRKQGFLLISFLVYMAIFSLVVCLVSMSITRYLLPAFASAREYNNVVGLYTATDIFVADIRNSGVKEWKKISSDEIIWSSDDEDIGWSFDKTHLERRTGKYENAWKKSTKSIIPCSASSVIFVPDYDMRHKNKVIGMQIQLFSPYTNSSLVGYGAIRYKKSYETKKG